MKKPDDVVMTIEEGLKVIVDYASARWLADHMINAETTFGEMCDALDALRRQVAYDFDDYTNLSPAVSIRSRFDPLVGLELIVTAAITSGEKPVAYSRMLVFAI